MWSSAWAVRLYPLIYWGSEELGEEESKEKFRSVSVIDHRNWAKLEGGGGSLCFARLVDAE
jgi:hypothetical protein